MGLSTRRLVSLIAVSLVVIGLTVAAVNDHGLGLSILSIGAGMLTTLLMTEPKNPRELKFVMVHRKRYENG
jgi:hypothetical protein